MLKYYLSFFLLFGFSWAQYNFLDIMADDVAQAALVGLRLAAMRPAFKPVHLAVNAAMASWLAGSGKVAVEALNRPLEIDICLDDKKAAVPYIIDKVAATH